MYILLDARYPPEYPFEWPARLIRFYFNAVGVEKVDLGLFGLQFTRERAQKLRYNSFLETNFHDASLWGRFQLLEAFVQVWHPVHMEWRLMLDISLVSSLAAMFYVYLICF